MSVYSGTEEDAPGAEGVAKEEEEERDTPSAAAGGGGEGPDLTRESI